MGTLLWMSIPCWPLRLADLRLLLPAHRLTFGSKVGAESLHIQWNSLKETIEVVNYSAGSAPNLSAMVEILNIDGTVVSSKSSAARHHRGLHCHAHNPGVPTNVSPVPLPARLTLSQNGTARSTNFYLRGIEQGNYRAIAPCPRQDHRHYRRRATASAGSSRRNSRAALSHSGALCPGSGRT